MNGYDLGVAFDRLGPGWRMSPTTETTRTWGSLTWHRKRLAEVSGPLRDLRCVQPDGRFVATPAVRARSGLGVAGLIGK